MGRRLGEFRQGTTTCVCTCVNICVSTISQVLFSSPSMCLNTRQKRVRQPFKPRSLPCPRNCGKFFINVRGVKSHMHVHYREDRLRNHHGRADFRAHSPSPMRSPSPQDLWDNGFNDYEDDYMKTTPPTSRSNSPDHSGQRRVEPEEIKMHEKINGESRLWLGHIFVRAQYI